MAKRTIKHFEQLSLFEAPPIIKKDVINTVIFQNRTYIKDGGVWFEKIGGKLYECYGAPLLAQLEAEWKRLNSDDARLFIEGGNQTQF